MDMEKAYFHHRASVTATAAKTDPPAASEAEEGTEYLAEELSSVSSPTKPSTHKSGSGGPGYPPHPGYPMPPGYPMMPGYPMGMPFYNPWMFPYPMNGKSYPGQEDASSDEEGDATMTEAGGKATHAPAKASDAPGSEGIVGLAPREAKTDSPKPKEKEKKSNKPPGPPGGMPMPYMYPYDPSMMPTPPPGYPPMHPMMMMPGYPMPMFGYPPNGNPPPGYAQAARRGRGRPKGTTGLKKRKRGEGDAEEDSVPDPKRHRATPPNQGFFMVNDPHNGKFELESADEDDEPHSKTPSELSATFAMHAAAATAVNAAVSGANVRRSRLAANRALAVPAAHLPKQKGASGAHTGAKKDHYEDEEEIEEYSGDSDDGPSNLPAAPVGRFRRSHWTPAEDSKLRELVEKYQPDIPWIEIAHLLGKHRTDCKRRWQTTVDPHINHGAFTAEEDYIIRAQQSKIGNKWSTIAKVLGNQRVGADVHARWKLLRGGSRSIRKWTVDEDNRLRSLIAEFGKDFKEISKHIAGRGQEDCRSRWMRHLDPAVNKMPFTIHEDRRMLELHAVLGNRWTAIARRLNSNRVGVDIQRRVSVLKRNGAKVPAPNPKDMEDSELIEDLAQVPRGPGRGPNAEGFDQENEPVDGEEDDDDIEAQSLPVEAADAPGSGHPPVAHGLLVAETTQPASAAAEVVADVAAPAPTAPVGNSRESRPKMKQEPKDEFVKPESSDSPPAEPKSLRPRRGKNAAVLAVKMAEEEDEEEEEEEQDASALAVTNLLLDG